MKTSVSEPNALSFPASASLQLSDSELYAVNAVGIQP